jgi:hypothetical protein
VNCLDVLAGDPIGRAVIDAVNFSQLASQHEANRSYLEKPGSTALLKIG